MGGRAEPGRARGAGAEGARPGGWERRGPAPGGTGWAPLPLCGCLLRARPSHAIPARCRPIPPHPNQPNLQPTPSNLGPISIPSSPHISKSSAAARPSAGTPLPARAPRPPATAPPAACAARRRRRRRRRIPRRPPAARRPLATTAPRAMRRLRTARRTATAPTARRRGRRGRLGFGDFWLWGAWGRSGAGRQSACRAARRPRMGGMGCPWCAWSVSIVTRQYVYDRRSKSARAGGAHAARASAEARRIIGAPPLTRTRIGEAAFQRSWFHPQHVLHCLPRPLDAVLAEFQRSLSLGRHRERRERAARPTPNGSAQRVPGDAGQRPPLLHMGPQRSHLDCALHRIQVADTALKSLKVTSATQRSCC